jgi:hypothetical protein
MAAIHSKSFESDLPVCRWKAVDSTRHYETTTDPTKVTCKKCISLDHDVWKLYNTYTPPAPKLETQTL